MPEAKLKPGLNAIDVLRATFPAGTVSGAPKVRVMEIIDELEASTALDSLAYDCPRSGSKGWHPREKRCGGSATAAKDDAIRDWCERITHQTGTQWWYCRVNQLEFDGKKSTSFAEAVG